MSCGSLTNVAHALKLDPGFAVLPKEFFALGGNVLAGTMSVFEYDADPDATRSVLGKMACPTYFVSLEFCIAYSTIPFVSLGNKNTRTNSSLLFLQDFWDGILSGIKPKIVKFLSNFSHLNTDVKFWMPSDQMAVIAVLLNDETKKAIGETRRASTQLI